MRSLFLGVEIGGTKLQLALGDSMGEIIDTRRGGAPAEGGAQAILDWFQREIPLFLAEASAHQAHVKAIGVGFGGPVESATGRALVSHQVGGWENIELKGWFENAFGLPALVANDSNAAGWAEYCRGAGQGTRHFFYTNIGSGIGGALIIDGKLHDGQGFGAGEMGHTYAPDWTSDAPGAADKVEHISSGWSIERRLRSSRSIPPGSPLGLLCRGHPESITCAMIAEAARQGDDLAIAEIERIARTLGLAIANVITLFHPERIAVGGGVALMGDILLDPVRRYTDRYVFGPFRNRYSIVPCQLGEFVVLVGAILLAAGKHQE